MQDQNVVMFDFYENKYLIVDSHRLNLPLISILSLLRQVFIVRDYPKCMGWLKIVKIYMNMRTI